jgi:hypothetical protein
MTADYPPLTQTEIQELFIDVESPAPNTFEFALVLGGTVSAGAFTAGVVDFLIEALDCWINLRDKNDASGPENKQLRLERDILSRAAAWFARETGTIASGSSSS